MGLSFFDYLKDYRKENMSAVEAITKEKWLKIVPIIKESFQGQYTNKSEAIRVIKNEFTDASIAPSTIDSKFLKENLNYVLDKLDTLSEGDIKIIINNGDSSKKESGCCKDVGVAAIELECADKTKKKRGRPSKKMIEEKSKEDEELEVIEEPPMDQDVSDELPVAKELTTDGTENIVVIKVIKDEEDKETVSLEIEENGEVIDSIPVSEESLDSVIEFLKTFYDEHEFSVTVDKGEDEGVEDVVEEPVEESIEEAIEMKKFIASVKHDKGVVKIKTSAQNKEDAITKIMKAEGCPKCSIVKIIEESTNTLKWSELFKEDVDQGNREVGIDVEVIDGENLIGKIIQVGDKWLKVIGYNKDTDKLVAVGTGSDEEVEVDKKEITDYEKEDEEDEGNEDEDKGNDEGNDVVEEAALTASPNKVVEKKENVKVVKGINKPVPIGALTSKPSKIDQKVEKVKVPSISKKTGSGSALTAKPSKFVMPKENVKVPIVTKKNPSSANLTKSSSVKVPKISGKAAPSSNMTGKPMKTIQRPSK